MTAGILTEYSLERALSLRRAIDLSNTINWLIPVFGALMVWANGLSDTFDISWTLPIWLVVACVIAHAIVALGTRWGCFTALGATLFWLLAFVPAVILGGGAAGLQHSAADPLLVLGMVLGASLAAQACLSGLGLSIGYIGQSVGGVRVDRILAAPSDLTLGVLSPLFEPLFPLLGYQRAPLAGIVSGAVSLVATALRAIGLTIIIPAIAMRYLRYWLLVFQVLWGLGGIFAAGFVSVIAAVGTTIGLVCLWFVLMILGWLIFRCAEAVDRLASLLLRQTFAQLSKRDERPPILFLRSFDDDQVSIRKRSTKFTVETLMQPAVRRLDHVLVERFSKYGPVVAIGRPGEKDLPFGAARLYVSDDVWRSKVEELATQARAIVIVAADTPGLQWEIETMLSRFQNKTIFLAQPGADGLESAGLVQDFLQQSVDARLSGQGNVALFKVQSDRWFALLGDRVPANYEIALQAFFRKERLSKAIDKGALKHSDAEATAPVAASVADGARA